MPDGARPLWAMSFDMKALQPAIQMGLSMAGEDAGMVRKQLELYKILGEDAWSMHSASGVKDGSMLVSFSMENWVTMAKAMGQYTDKRLSAADFAMLPADANMASLQVQNLSGLMDQLRGYMQVDDSIHFDDFIETINNQVGFNLETDLFSTLGNVSAFYTAESTGGGGLTSGVFLLEVADSARLTQTMAGLSDKYLGFAQGRIRFSHWQHGQVACTTINTPGFPVPVEISMAFQSGYLIVGLSRGALMGALDHITQGKPGLMASEELRGLLPHAANDLTMFSYSDSKSMVREGYAPISLIYNALANGALSPTDETRDMGMVMPSYSDIMQATKPQVFGGWVEGNDLVMRGTAGSSITANLVTLAGNPTLRALVPLFALGVGASRAEQMRSDNFDVYEDKWPSPEQPKASGTTAKIQNDITMLNAGLELYILDYNGQGPANLELLLGDKEGESYIWGDMIPLDPWGNAYRYEVSADGSEWSLMSLGADGMLGGAGEDADIDRDALKRLGY